MNVNLAHLSLPKPGERKNGDAVLVRRDEGGGVLLAVIDGLGHGPLAAEASQAAVDLLQAQPFQTSLLDTMQALHARLRDTRGAVATLCVIDKQKMVA